MNLNGITLIVVLIYSGTISLQIYLSKKYNKKYGRILPVLNIIFSTVLFLIFTYKDIKLVDSRDKITLILRNILNYGLYNILTVILFGIYETEKNKIEEAKKFKNSKKHNKKKKKK